MPKVRYWGVDGDEVNRDFGTIELTPEGDVLISERLEWIVAPGSMLPAPKDIRDPQSPSTAPAGGFRLVGGRGKVLRYEPVEREGWDGALWLDKVRYHFRTVYVRPGEVEP